MKFRVKQQPGLPCETQIFNTAAIYFDYQTPQYTNETFHTVCERDSFVIVKTVEIFVPGADVKIYPNPFASSTLFEISGVAAQSYTLELYDAQGRQIIHDIYSHPYFRLYRDQIPSGMLFYRLLADGKLVAAGKLIAD